MNSINLVITDTCNTQRAVGRLLTGPNSPLEQTFWVPCDSHSLQLLMKDIIMMPVWQNLVTIAQNIVTAFTTSHKQLAILRDLMQKRLRKTYSFILSVITR
jgi:hypothetical protein